MRIIVAGEAVREADADMVWWEDVSYLNDDPAVDFR